jgi:hypothetical protein
MKRLICTFLLVTVAMMLVGVNPASAQGTWNTGIDIQNLSATGGTVMVEFYTSAGASAGSISGSIDAWGSLSFYLPTQPSPPSGGQYSAVVSSDVPVAATSSQTNTGLGGADIYLGTSSPQTTLSFPLVYRNHSGGTWNTKLIVQNASNTAQTVYLSLYIAGATTPAATDSASVQPYAYKVFTLSDSAYSAFGNTYGSAVVTSTVQLAGVADHTRNVSGLAVNYINSSYRAFGPAQQGTAAVLPLVYKNYGSFTSGINIVNKGAISTTVTITYTNANPAIVGGPWVDSLVLAGKAMGSFYTPSNGSLPNNYYGSAVLSSSATDISVVVASQRYLTSGAQGMAYEGSLPTDATPCVSLPVTHNRTTWKTGINILNLGSSEANVTINYVSSAPGIGDATQSFTISANSPRTIYMPTQSPTTLGFYGSADVKSTNSQPLLINVANSRSDATIVAATNYVGINYTCP